MTKPFETDVGQKNTKYQPGTGRQVRVNHIEPQPGGSLLLVRADSLLYDASGNVAFSWTMGRLRAVRLCGTTGRCITRPMEGCAWWTTGRRR